MEALKKISELSIKEQIPVFNVGDTVKVDVKIKEGEKERVQIFEGVVIAEKGSGVAKSFTVRKISYGVGIERIFLIHSPNVKNVKIIKKGIVRRSKLYYLRDKIGKAAKIKERLN